MPGFSRRRTKLTGRADPPHRPEGDDWPAEVELAAAERLSFRTSSALQRWNTVWLLAIIVTPFATRILNGDGANALRFAFYALVQVLATGAFLFMVRAMDRGALLRPDTPATLVPRATRRLSATLAGFAASVPLFFVTAYAWVLWFTIPILWGRLVRWRGRRVVSEGVL